MAKFVAKDQAKLSVNLLFIFNFLSKFVNTGKIKHMPSTDKKLRTKEALNKAVGLTIKINNPAQLIEDKKSYSLKNNGAKSTTIAIILALTTENDQSHK